MHLRIGRAIRVAALSAGLALVAHGTAYADQGCVTGFDPPEVIVANRGGSFSFNVLTSNPSCQWMVENFSTMMSFPQPLAGTGPTTVTVATVIPNLDLTPRTLSIVIGGRTLSVFQPGAECVWSVVTPPAPIPANGGTGTLTVNGTGRHCYLTSYTATSASNGLTIQSGQTGSVYPATVSFTVAPNTNTFNVTHTINVIGAGMPLVATIFAAVLQNGPPVKTNAPSTLVFARHQAATGSVSVSEAEPVLLTNTEQPSSAWNASVDVPWIRLSSGAGSGPGMLTIGVDETAAAALAAGTHQGTVQITSAVAPVTPTKIDVVLKVTTQSATTVGPFGVLDIPANGSTGLSGAIAMGGWAGDDVGVTRVQLYRSAVAGEGPGPIYMGEATRVRGARPDVATLMQYPGVRSAGWGLMVLTNVFPNSGNGTFTLSAYADDVEGKRTLLGQKTITLDNTAAIKPFGTIDIPSQGGTASGLVAVQGWALAQNKGGRFIPFDGSTISLYIDGAGTPAVASYNHNRPDVEALFPLSSGYANSAGAGVSFMLDTTALADGLHTVSWTATDNLGTIEGLGSRYFTVSNGAGSMTVVAHEAASARSVQDVNALPLASTEMLVLRGFDSPYWSSSADRVGGTRVIQQRQGERVEVTLDSWSWLFGCSTYTAYLLAGETAGPLPIGASFDAVKGIFTWQPPPEFAGTFEFVFVRSGCGSSESRVPLRVLVGPGSR
jgi:hypothetical protein